METKIYTIKDTVTGAMENIVQAPNEAAIIRSLDGIINSGQQNELTKYLGDKQLYCLGTFNMKTGEIKSEVRFVKNLMELKRVEEEKHEN